jgi:hypothetical protein
MALSVVIRDVSYEHFPASSWSGGPQWIPVVEAAQNASRRIVAWCNSFNQHKNAPQITGHLPDFVLLHAAGNPMMRAFRVNLCGDPS